MLHFTVTLGDLTRSFATQDEANTYARRQLASIARDFRGLERIWSMVHLRKLTGKARSDAFSNLYVVTRGIHNLAQYCAQAAAYLGDPSAPEWAEEVQAWAATLANLDRSRAAGWDYNVALGGVPVGGVA